MKTNKEAENAIINKLREENRMLKERVEELEQIIMDNRKIIESAKEFQEAHKKAMESAKSLKKTYEQAIAEVHSQKKMYKAEMDGLLKTIKKNV